MVRRTSEIALMGADDEEVINAKGELYQYVNGNWNVNKDIIHRQMSNNSIYYKQKPTRDRLHWQIERMRYSGEPGFANQEAAAKRRTNFNGINPCGEILLDNKGLCNLTTTNVMAFVHDGVLDEKALLKAHRLGSRASYRMTNVELELPKWDQIQKRDRLEGVSLTGWQDMVNSAGMTKDQQIELLKKLRIAAHQEGIVLAKQIGANEPLLVTTVKPEGTLSQLPTVSSGVHYSHSPFYIRRVRITSNDPVAKVLSDLGYPIFPEVGQDWDTCSTKVVEFPVRAPEGRTKYDVSAIEQLENYKMFMEYYVDHNASITVSVRSHEWDEVEQWIWDNWDTIVGVSFLALEDSFYKLMPYESIDEDEFLKREAAINGKRITPDKIAKYETVDDILTLELDESCDTGACPVR